MCQPGTCWGWPYNCYASDEQRTDFFVWDGRVVFYGQAYDTWVYNNGGPSFSDSLFWDVSTGRWYSLVPRHVVTVSKAGVGSGVVTAFPGGINCGDVCRASYPAGSEIVLGVQPDPGFAFAGWLGDCRYTSPYCHFWLDRDWSVTASFGDPPPPPPPPPPNIAPVAGFGRDCDRLTCRFDAHASADSDGSIGSYRWSFGDGDTGTNLTTAHTYATAGSYDVELSVTDNRGAVSTTTKSVTVSAEPVPTWNVAADFRVAPNQANPNPDSFGNPAVWSFLQGASLAHDPGSYRLLSDFLTDRFGVEGFESWQGAVVSGDARTDRLPSVSVNTRSDNPYQPGIDWPPGTVLVHPLPDQVAAVGWRSPTSGTVQVSGRVADAQTACGDGVDWSVDKGATTLASGSIPSGGSQFFISAPAAANLASVAVGVGDVLYFVVGPGPSGSHICDSTSLDVTIRRMPTGGVINSFTPTSGEVGTVVDIVGAKFTDATNVTFNGAAAIFTVESSTNITATVPDGATTGPITVTTPEGTATSNSTFTVTTAAPEVRSFTPTRGPEGTTIVIDGARFTGATSVAVDGTAANYSVDSDSRIHATVPNGATTGPISVTTPAGTATSSSTFTVVPAPTIAGFSPTAGSPGTSVNLQGENLSAATAVTFNGASAAFTVESSTRITTTVPTGATTGPISVTTADGTGTSESSFTVTVPPAISSFTPIRGPAGTGVDILGRDFTGATSVAFNGTDTSYTVHSDTHIHAQVPSGATSGQVSVTTPSGTATSSSSFTLTPPPTITGFTPTSGRAGRQVTITGSNFADVSGVKLGTTPATFTVNSSTGITAVVPTIARGYYKWSVTTASGTVTSPVTFHVR